MHRIDAAPSVSVHFGHCATRGIGLLLRLLLLVARLHEFVFRGQVDPELQTDAVDSFGGVGVKHGHFRVDNPLSSCHPLDVACLKPPMT